MAAHLDGRASRVGDRVGLGAGLVGGSGHGGASVLSRIYLVYWMMTPASDFVKLVLDSDGKRACRHRLLALREMSVIAVE